MRFVHFRWTLQEPCFPVLLFFTRKKNQTERKGNLITLMSLIRSSWILSFNKKWSTKTQLGTFLSTTIWSLKWYDDERLVIVSEQKRRLSHKIGNRKQHLQRALENNNPNNKWNSNTAQKQTQKRRKTNPKGKKLHHKKQKRGNTILKMCSTENNAPTTIKESSTTNSLWENESQSPILTMEFNWE